MRAQLDWCNTPVARSSDPKTSHAAAEALSRGPGRQRDQALLLGLIEEFPGRTAMEYAQLLIDRRGLHWLRAQQVASKRISDLATASLVLPVGERSCTLTGRLARIWRSRGRTQ